MVPFFHLRHPEEFIRNIIKYVIHAMAQSPTSKMTQHLTVYFLQNMSQVTASDPFPNLICHRCLYEVDRFYDFKEICEKANTTLQQCFDRCDSIMDLTKVKNILLTSSVTSRA